MVREFASQKDHAEKRAINTISDSLQLYAHCSAGTSDIVWDGKTDSDATLSTQIRSRESTVSPAFSAAKVGLLCVLRNINTEGDDVLVLNETATFNGITGTFDFEGCGSGHVCTYRIEGNDVILAAGTSMPNAKKEWPPKLYHISATSCPP